MRLVYEDRNYLCDRYSIRCVGFPEGIVLGISKLLHTTVFWGNSEVARLEGFWVYQTPVLVQEGEIPFTEISKWVSSRLRSYNRCFHTIKQRT